MTRPRQWTVAIGVVMALVFGTALVIKIRPQIDLRPDLDDQCRAEHQRHHHANRHRPLPRPGHTVTRQRRRRSRTSRAGALLVKIALPATNVSAPAPWAGTM